jgi:diguanylate cyclase (GGDEF)-like protein
MLLLPTLMLHVELVTLWDLIRLKMGADPDQGIPLFRGLSKNQVHYIMMAGAIRSLVSGERLFRRGDSSDSMFAVISGRLDVLDEDDVAAAPLARRIARLGTGDVVGEMGLVRAAPRSATVVAADPAELLLINRRMIRRLQWLYPPTAQKFFFNLLTILCDRLEATNLSLSAVCSRDDVTGLCNRREFVHRLTHEIDRARRYGTRLSVGMLALPSGATAFNRRARDDHALGALARHLALHVRGCDLFARVAPDTLALLLPHTPADQARTTLGRLVSLTRATTADDARSGAVRIAVIPCDGDPTLSADELLTAAQARLGSPER